MLININRKIFNALQGDVQQTYIYEKVSDALMVEIDNENELATMVKFNCNEIATNIQTVIKRNEEVIQQVGLKKYYNNNITADQYVSGYYYSSGKIVICPFDWSMENEDDENFSYSFVLAVVV